MCKYSYNNSSNLKIDKVKIQSFQSLIKCNVKVYKVQIQN